MTSSPAGVHRDVLVAHLDTLLDAQTGQDYCPNGLQVEGRPLIRRLITGVSGCLELFQEARRRDADAVLVHHGIFWHGAPSVLTGLQYGRVRELVEGGLNLIAYHLPLDRHGEVGNNALAAVEFGLEERRSFAPHKGLPVGIMGSFPSPISIDTLRERCENVYGQRPLVFDGGPAEIRRLGIVSGGAQKDLYAALDEGLDAFITGEVSEWVMNVSREAGIHYLAAGHYATERLGIRRLGDIVAQTFPVETTFIDIPNPV